MPSWDDPGVKWDDVAFGWNGGTPVARVPTWADATSTWGDPGEGWNGEVGDIQIAVPPGVYVKDPGVNSNMLQASMVTQGVPGQPASDIGMYLKVVVPPGHENEAVYYDLDYLLPQPLSVSPSATHGYFAVNYDDGLTWPSTPAWFTTAGGLVYKRSGNTVYRIVTTIEATMAMRVRFNDDDWLDCSHIIGVPTTLNPALPAGMSRVRSSSPSSTGPIARNPGGTTVRDVNTLAMSDRTLWRRAGYTAVTLNLSGLNVASFTVRSSPVGYPVWGHFLWRQGGNWLQGRFGPVADNTAVTTAMCTVVGNQDTIWIGQPVGSIGGWTNIPMAAGYTLSIEAYSLIGAGTPTDPYNQSAQHRLYYTP